MTYAFTREKLVTRIALCVGICLPFIYYGAQFVAAPFFPGYSFIRDMASVLGSATAKQPMIWNTGMILLGLATIFAAFGFFRGFQQIGTRSYLTWISSVAILSNGSLSIASGIFPLGDPRHNGGLLAIGALLLPWIFAASLWRQKDARLLRFYLIASGTVVFAMAPIMGQAVEMGLNDYRGLLQRVLTLGMFPPLGLVAWYLNKISSRHGALNESIPDAR
jgi:hypothetical membrane protein